MVRLGCQLPILLREWLRLQSPFRKKSELVWEKMLPPDYKWAVKTAHGDAISYRSLKQLYDCLCGYILVEDGLKGYGCDRTTGRMYRTFAARTLDITWGSDDRYWQWVRGSMVPGSRSAEVPCLKAVCWLELKGEIKTQLLPGTYSLCWVLKWARTSEDVPMDMEDSDNYSDWLLAGWKPPIRFTLTYGVDDQSSKLQFPPKRDHEVERVQWKDHDWFEYSAGNFTVEEIGNSKGIREVKLKVKMEQTESNWKHNLLVDGDRESRKRSENRKQMFAQFPLIVCW